MARYSHILIVAEKRGEVKSVLGTYSATEENSNKAISQAAPKTEGKKCHKKKPKKGKNDMKM